MTSRHVFWALIGTAFGLAVADAVFATVTKSLWPVPDAAPSWQPQVFWITWLAALSLTVAAVFSYALRRKRVRARRVPAGRAGDRSPGEHRPT